jgi:outer membrane immunogenic protein
MLRKIVMVAAVLVTTSSVAFADGVPYVGADLGLNSSSFSLKNSAGNKTNLHSSGVTGGLFAGYGVTVNQNIYLGGEAFVNTGSMSTSTKTTNTRTTDKLKTTYSYGLDFMPGYKFTESTMAYLKAGIVRTRFKLTQNAPTSNLSGSSENTVTGGQLGLGLQTDVSSNVAVRGEFLHTSYNSFTAFGSKVKPTNNQVNFGLVYKFN